MVSILLFEDMLIVPLLAVVAFLSPIHSTEASTPIWQKIAIAACEQCGRNEIPEIRPIMKLTDWCKEQDDMLKLNLHPRAKYTIRQLPNVPEAGVRLLIGSEGGLSAEEIAMTETQGFTEVLLGKRVLRTETASLAAITALQVCFGDI